MATAVQQYSRVGQTSARATRKKTKASIDVDVLLTDRKTAQQLQPVWYSAYSILAPYAAPPSSFGNSQDTDKVSSVVPRTLNICTKCTLKTHPDTELQTFGHHGARIITHNLMLPTMRVCWSWNLILRHNTVCPPPYAGRTRKRWCTLVRDY